MKYIDFKKILESKKEEYILHINKLIKEDYYIDNDYLDRNKIYEDVRIKDFGSYENTGLIKYKHYYHAINSIIINTYVLHSNFDFVIGKKYFEILLSSFSFSTSHDIIKYSILKDADGKNNLCVYVLKNIELDQLFVYCSNLLIISYLLNINIFSENEIEILGKCIIGFKSQKVPRDILSCLGDLIEYDDKISLLIEKLKYYFNKNSENKLLKIKKEITSFTKKRYNQSLLIEDVGSASMKDAINWIEKVLWEGNDIEIIYDKMIGVKIRLISNT